jgi:hypothetical protein
MQHLFGEWRVARRGRDAGVFRRKDAGTIILVMSGPRATHDYTPGGGDAALAFIKRTRAELRPLRKVRLWKDRLQVIDVNKDCFEIRGLGYDNPDVIPILQEINAAYKPETIHLPIDADFKELDTGRRHPWAEDRVM